MPTFFLKKNRLKLQTCLNFQTWLIFFSRFFFQARWKFMRAGIIGTDRKSPILACDFCERSTFSKHYIGKSGIIKRVSRWLSMVVVQGREQSQGHEFIPRADKKKEEGKSSVHGRTTIFEIPDHAVFLIWSWNCFTNLIFVFFWCIYCKFSLFSIWKALKT